MLTIDGPMVGPNTINVYNTSNWTLLHSINPDGLTINSAVWTSAGKILATVQGNRDTFRKMVYGHLVEVFDVGFLLLDPAGKEPTVYKWFPAVPELRPQSWPTQYSIGYKIYDNNIESGKVLVAGPGVQFVDAPDSLMDDRTFELLKYKTNESDWGGGGSAFTPDGKLLFLKETGWFDLRSPITNRVVDTHDGKVLATFGGESGNGHEGIAISPNGKFLALGEFDAVQILMMQNQ